MVVPSIPSALICTKWCCTAFLLAKTKKKSIESSVTSDLAEVEGVFTNKDVTPGHKVLCDQYMSPTKVCRIHIRGKE